MAPIRMTHFLLALALLGSPALAAPPAQSPGDPPRPAMEITVQADRSSEFPMTAEQTRRFDEATKISAALRVFYSLYERWPQDLAELRSRTTGIDYDLLESSLKLQRVDGAMGLVFSDGENERRVLVPPQPATDPYSRDDAQQPGFTFEVKLYRPDAPQSREKTAYDDPDSPEWARLQRDASEAMAKALEPFPNVKKAYFFAGFEENGISKFGLALVEDGEVDMAPYEAASAAFKRVAPADKGLQLHLMTPDSLQQLIEQASLEPFFSRP